MWQKNPDEYYPQDVERVKTTNWPIQRYILSRKKNKEEAIDYLIKAMKWRKSFGVYELSEKDFPKEFYQSGGVFLYGKDKNGGQLLIARAKVNRKIKSWVPTLRRYAVYLIEKIDQMNTASQKGLTAVIYCKGAGIKNVDLDSMQFGLKVVREYYPGLLCVGLVHKLPTVLEPVFKTVLSWLNEEEKKFIHITNKKNINEYVAIEELPDFLLGTNALSYRVVPNDAPTAIELAKKLGLKEGKAEKLMKHVEPFLNE